MVLWRHGSSRGRACAGIGRRRQPGGPVGGAVPRRPRSTRHAGGKAREQFGSPSRDRLHHTDVGVVSRRRSRASRLHARSCPAAPGPRGKPRRHLVRRVFVDGQHRRVALRILTRSGHRHRPRPTRTHPAQPGRRIGSRPTAQHRDDRLHPGRRRGDRHAAATRRCLLPDAGPVRRRGRRSPQPHTRRPGHQSQWRRTAVGSAQHLVPGADRPLPRARRRAVRDRTARSHRHFSPPIQTGAGC